MYLILAFIVIGMAAGWLAHFVVEPHRTVNWPVLFVAGLVGSFVGGLIASLISGNGLAFKPSGIIGSVVGAILFLLVRRLFFAGKPAKTTARGKSSAEGEGRFAQAPLNAVSREAARSIRPTAPPDDNWGGSVVAASGRAASASG